MLALEISINGKKFVLAGFQDWNLLHAHVNASRSEEINMADELEVVVGGLARPVDSDKLEHVRWGRKSLAVEDEVRFRFVNTEAADKPIKRYRSDRSVQESPFTDEEIREMQFKDYIRLKRIFEGEDAANKALNRTPDGAA